MSKKQIGSCLFLGCLMRPPRLSCTVSEFSYGCRRPSVQWHGRKVVTSWNCSQRGLWIIWSKNVLISGKRSSCWVFPNVFFERFERHRVPSHSREGGRLDYRWTNRRSTTGKRKNRCNRWIVPLILKMHMQIAEENQISSHSRKPIF